MAAEMGLSYRQILECTLAEFNILYVGYRRRQEEAWDIARHGWAYIISFGGMGLKKDAKAPTPQDLYELQYRDREAVKGSEQTKPITTENEAYQLLKEFE